MNTYKIHDLGSETTQTQQDRLIDALRSVRGVKTASLRLDRSEITVEPREQQTIKQAEITSAVARAGFSVART